MRFCVAHVGHDMPCVAKRGCSAARSNGSHNHKRVKCLHKEHISDLRSAGCRPEKSDWQLESYTGARGLRQRARPQEASRCTDSIMKMRVVRPKYFVDSACTFGDAVPLCTKSSSSLRRRELRRPGDVSAHTIT